MRKSQIRNTTTLAGMLLVAAIAAAQTPVVVISIDTLRADHLSAYGYHAISTPNIDAFAEHGTLFTNISAQVPLTLPSHTSLFTSTYPFQNGVEENGEVVPASAVTLASVMQSHGYKTAAFIGSFLLARSAGLDKGFENYDSPFGSAGAREGEKESPYSSRVRRDGALVLRAASQWLAAQNGQPTFVFIHLFDLHAPYKLGGRAGSALPEKAGYDAEIRYVDQLMGRVTKTDWFRQSIVVLLADHGEGLGDHGETSHGYFAYQSTLHVPLMIHWPSAMSSFPARVTQPGGLIDVGPTLLDALHLPVPSSFEGASLIGPPERPVFSESVYARDQFGWAPLRALRIGQWKFILAPRPELYDLGKDPRELLNVLRGNAAEATTLRAELTKLLARYTREQPAQSPPSSTTKNALGSLGYLAGGQANPTATGVDPKDRIAEYQLFERALDAFYAGRLEEAIADLRRVRAQDPTNKPAADALAEYEKVRKVK
jgi:choline-sulfatase